MQIINLTALRSGIVGFLPDVSVATAVSVTLNISSTVYAHITSHSSYNRQAYQFKCFFIVNIADIDFVVVFQVPFIKYMLCRNCISCHDLSSNQTDPFQLSLYCVDTTPTLSSLCDKADLALFDNIITSSTHPLHSLLPPKEQKHYSTRPRGHCYQLPRKTTALDESNFFYRLLYRDILLFTFTD